MSAVSIGDLAQAFMLRRQTGQAKSDLARLTEQVASGRVADPAARTGGDHAPVAAVERSLALLTSQRSHDAETEQMLAQMQGALSRAQDESVTVADAAYAAASSGQGGQLGLVAAQGRAAIDGVVAALNASIGGRTMFSGAATDSPALLPGPELRAMLVAHTAGETTAEGVAAALNDFFGPGGDFEQEVYQGSDMPAGPFRLGAGETAAHGISATDPALRETLKGLSMAMLAGDGAISGDLEEAAGLARRSGDTLLAAQAALAQTRGGLGDLEARLDAAVARGEAEIGALETARADLVGVDPFEAATKLDASRQQLELMHVLTARLSRLSLTEFL